MAELSLRVDRVLSTLHRECSEMRRVIIVCHGEVMWAFRMRLERWTQEHYRELDASKHPHNRLHNCQILHYSRNRPYSDTVYNKYMVVRSICPTDTSLSSNEWQEMPRPIFTCEELRERAEAYPRLIPE